MLIYLPSAQDGENIEHNFYVHNYSDLDSVLSGHICNSAFPQDTALNQIWANHFVEVPE